MAFHWNRPSVHQTVLFSPANSSQRECGFEHIWSCKERKAPKVFQPRYVSHRNFYQMLHQTRCRPGGWSPPPVQEKPRQRKKRVKASRPWHIRSEHRYVQIPAAVWKRDIFVHKAAIKHFYASTIGYKKPCSSGCIWIALYGQIAVHIPQPVHILEFTATFMKLPLLGIIASIICTSFLI